MEELLQKPSKMTRKITFIGAGTIGTALGNVIASAGKTDVVLHSIEKNLVESINSTHFNNRYFPSIQLNPRLRATTSLEDIDGSDVIFLAIPSVALMKYIDQIKSFLPPEAIVVNLAKGFGFEHKTIISSLDGIIPNQLCTLKGPSFAREIITNVPTSFTLGYSDPEAADRVCSVFDGTSIFLDRSDDIEGVEILSILKNIYAICLGIVDAQFNSPNIRFLVLTKAFQEMHRILLMFGGKEETIFKYCGYGDFTLTALNDLSRNRTLGLLIGKGFFTEHISHELVLEGQVATSVFYEEISRFRNVKEEYPIISELYKIFTDHYEVSDFVNVILRVR